MIRTPVSVEGKADGEASVTRMVDWLVPVDTKVGKSTVAGAGDPEQGTPLLTIESTRPGEARPTGITGLAAN